MAHESVGRTFTVAIIIFSICSFLVSGAAVGLHDKQQANKELDRKKNILIAAGIYDANVPIAETFQMVDTKIVDLATGEYVSSDVLDPAIYDQRLASQDTDLGIEVGGAGIEVKGADKKSFSINDHGFGMDGKDRGILARLFIPVDQFSLDGGVGTIFIDPDPLRDYCAALLVITTEGLEIVS